METAPPPQDPFLALQALRDQEDLGRLVLFHKILGWLLCVGSCIGLPHFGIGIFMMTGAIPITDSKSGKPDPGMNFMGPMFAFIGLAVILFILTGSFLNFRAARWVGERSKLTPLYVISALNLLFQPIGLALGVYSFVVLSRNSVKALFDVPPTG